MRTAIAAIFLIMSPFSGTAQVLGDIDVIEALMLDAGMTAEQDTRQNGDPMIVSYVDDMQFAIFFNDCTDSCESLQFVAGFAMQPHRAVSLQAMNAWNRQNPFSRAYLDRVGDPIVEMDVNLARDGIGRSNFNDLLARWAATLIRFRDYINW